MTYAEGRAGLAPSPSAGRLGRGENRHEPDAARRRHRSPVAQAARLPARVHALRQPHHVDLRCGARRRPRSRSRAPRGRRGPHGRRPRPPDRRSRHCARHRRARPRQCGRRAVHRARGRIADGAAVRPRRDLGARPRRLPGASPGRHGQAGDQGIVDVERDRDARPRHRRGIRIATSGRRGPVHLSLPSDLLDARIADSAVVWPDRLAPSPAALADSGRGQSPGRHRRRRAPRHHRRSADVECRAAARCWPSSKPRPARPPSSWRARAASPTPRSAPSPI